MPLCRCPLSSPGFGAARQGGPQFTLLEDVIIHNLDELFELHNIVAACPFRITRNSDLEIDEEAEDL